MKYKIEGKKEKETVVEKEVTISLKLNSNGNVDVIGTNKEGRRWYLLELRQNGTVYRERGVPNGVGFQTNAIGRIKESEL